jgi:hypothetical protein
MTLNPSFVACASEMSGIVFFTRGGFFGAVTRPGFFFGRSDNSYPPAQVPGPRKDYATRHKGQDTLLFQCLPFFGPSRTGEYVNGDVHTNGIENFWSLYKRAWKGTYTHNARKHTVRYVDERTFSFNNREMNDLERMVAVTSSVSGRRLTYAELKAGN